LDGRILLVLRIIVIASAILVVGASVLVIGAALVWGSITSAGLDTLLHFALGFSFLSLASYLYLERTQSKLPENNQIRRNDPVFRSENDT